MIRPTKKSIFNTHDPKGIRRLFQLRVALSPLREHKFRKIFKDTPSSICSCRLEGETTEHFLFRCTNYVEARNTMMQVINAILEDKNLHFTNNEMFGKFLLYGHDTFTENENVAVLKATLKYIHDSMRFQPVNE